MSPARLPDDGPRIPRFRIAWSVSQSLEAVPPEEMKTAPDRAAEAGEEPRSDSRRIDDE